MTFSKRYFSVFVWLLVILVVCITVSAQRKRTKQMQEGVTFSLEMPMKRTVRLPEEVLEILAREERVSSCLEGEQKDIDNVFSTAPIDLDSDGKMDVVVKAEDACLWGANQGPFWVFVRTEQGFQLIFHTYGLGISIESSSTNGFRDISTGAAQVRESFDATYKFDGQTYQLWRCTSTSTKGRTIRVRCSEYNYLPQPYKLRRE
jgi:hypothetical protein